MILINQRQPPITLETPHVFSGEKNSVCLHCIFEQKRRGSFIPAQSRHVEF
jgi:hypothetical protein